MLQFNQIVQLQARVKTLENTLEYLTRSPALSDANRNGSVNNSRLKTESDVRQKQFQHFLKTLANSLMQPMQPKKLYNKGVSAKSTNATAMDRWAKLRQMAELEEELS